MAVYICIYTSSIYRDIAELCDEVEGASAAMWVGSFSKRFVWEWWVLYSYISLNSGGFYILPAVAVLVIFWLLELIYY
jgi:hypothetical protein